MAGAVAAAKAAAAAVMAAQHEVAAAKHAALEQQGIASAKEAAAAHAAHKRSAKSLFMGVTTFIMLLTPRKDLYRHYKQCLNDEPDERISDKELSSETIFTWEDKSVASLGCSRHAKNILRVYLIPGLRPQ